MQVPTAYWQQTAIKTPAWRREEQLRFEQVAPSLAYEFAMESDLLFLLLELVRAGFPEKRILLSSALELQ